MSYEIIENFLEEEDLNNLQNLILGSRDSTDFTWNIITEVANRVNNDDFDKETEEQLWNWYGVHRIYDIVPLSPHFDYIAHLFFNKLDFNALIRVKTNFYPYTTKVEEHAQHYDFSFSHRAGLFSLNTCDGFTRMSNGDKVQSVANRMIIFDGSEYHSSSTTSNEKGRYNINFNWL